MYRSLFPHVSKIFPAKVLKFVGKKLPWPDLIHIIDLAETLNVHARGIYETKKRLLGLGKDATVTQIGDGKDIISILCACITDLVAAFSEQMGSFTVRANAEASEPDRMSEEEIVAQIMYARSAF